VNGCIGNTEVVTVWSGTGVTLSPELLLSSTTALAFRPGLNVAFDGANGQLQS